MKAFKLLALIMVLCAATAFAHARTVNAGHDAAVPVAVANPFQLRLPPPPPPPRGPRLFGPRRRGVVVVRTYHRRHYYRRRYRRY